MMNFKIKILIIILLTLSCWWAMEFYNDRENQPEHLKTYSSNMWWHDVRWAGARFIDPDKALQEQSRQYSVDGVMLEIPVVHFLIPPLSTPPGGAMSSLLQLYYMWPDFSAIPDFDHKDAYDHAMQRGYQISLYLVPHPQPLSNALELVDGLEKNAQSYALEQYTQSGMKTDSAITHFIAKDAAGNLSDYIYCSPDESQKRICYHNFDHKGLRFSPVYSYDLLSNWKTVRRRLIEIIDSYIVE